MKKLPIYTALIPIVFFFTLFFFPFSIFNSTAHAAITSGLIDYWTFDEGSGNTAGDSSGSGNAGTLTGGPTWTTGRVGTGALLFNATQSQYVNIPSQSVPTDFSYSAWVQTSQTGFIISGGLARILLIYNGCGQGMRVYFSVAGNNPCSGAANSSATVTDGAWHQVTGVNVGNTQVIYVDGVAGNPGSQTLNNASGYITIGQSPWNGFFTGSIDDVRIYNRALTPSEVTDLYNYTGTGTPPPPPPPPLPPQSTADITPPSIPGNLSATAISSSQISLTWSASTDPTVNGAITSGVAGYKVYRGGIQVGIATTNSYSDTNLNASTAYSYTVSAYDAASIPNNSAQSGSAGATTQSTQPPTIDSTVFFVRPGATGNGTSWTNAWGNFSNIDWTKINPGTTICLGGGTYNQILNPQKSGTSNSLITIKRAISSDPQCGTNSSGWNNSYDSQVVLPGVLFNPIGIGSYLVLDGQIDNGIKVIVPNTVADSAGILFGSGESNVTLKYLDIAGPDTVGNIKSLGDNSCINTTAWTGYGYDLVSDLTISYSKIHGCINLIKLIGNTSNVLIEKNELYDAIAPPPWHTNVIIVMKSNNVTFRYNKIYNWNSEGILLNPTSNASGKSGAWYIYGNIWAGGYPGATDRILEPQYSGEGPVYFYNNTVVNSRYGINAGDGSGWALGSKSRNNIFWNIFAMHTNYNGSPMSTGFLDSDYDLSDIPLANETHSVITTQDPLVSISTENYHLTNGSTAINKAASLINDGYINKDFEGNTRGADGIWDIGAYEYTGGTVTPPPATSIIGDFNHDGIVNSLDLSMLTSAWNTNNPTYDLNADSVVNSLDYVIMVRNWTMI